MSGMLTILEGHSGTVNRVAWSPDGTHIAFISDRDGVGAIYLMTADGNDPIRLTPRDSWNDSPSWRPAPGLAARGVPPPTR